MNDDEIFGNFVCSICCLAGKVNPSSGWGDSSRQDMTCLVCKNKRSCHLISTSDLGRIKSEIRNQKIIFLGI